MAGTFATWQPEYAARGLATFPLRSDDRKRPAVGNYNRMGMNASRQLAMKWGDAEGLACMAGSRNKLTVIDIDARGAEGERLLADVQREVGDARFIVRTGGGGFHAWRTCSASRPCSCCDGRSGVTARRSASARRGSHPRQTARTPH